MLADRVYTYRTQPPEGRSRASKVRDGLCVARGNKKGFAYSAFPRCSAAHNGNTLASPDGEADIRKNVRSIRLVANSDIPKLNLSPSWPILRCLGGGDLIMVALVSRFGKGIVRLLFVIQRQILLNAVKLLC